MFAIRAPPGRAVEAEEDVATGLADDADSEGLAVEEDVALTKNRIAIGFRRLPPTSAA